MFLCETLTTVKGHNHGFEIAKGSYEAIWDRCSETPAEPLFTLTMVLAQLAA